MQSGGLAASEPSSGSETKPASAVIALIHLLLSRELLLFVAKNEARIFAGISANNNSGAILMSKELSDISVLTITKENFSDEVLKSDKPVLLDFWAPWCGPCRMVSPVVDEIAGEVATAKVGKINIDEQPELASAFSIMSVPTLAVIKEGKIVKSAVGAKTKSAILQMLEA